jgi:hypothetical protein
MIAAALAGLLTAAPHVVVVQRSLLGLPATSAAPIIEDVRAHLEAVGFQATIREPCKRGSNDCLDAAASTAAAAIGVSVASGPRGLSVDLEAKSAFGETLGTWTCGLPASQTKLPPEALPFFSSLAEKLRPAPAPQPAVVERPSPAPAPRPARPLFIAAAAAAAVSFGLSSASVAMRGPLDAQLAMPGVITTLTRDDARRQVATVNGLLTASLVLVLTALGLGAAGLIAALLD